MAGIWEVLTALLVGFLILDFLKLLWSSRRYPPGPLPLPFIGGLWQIGSKLSMDSLTKLSKKYGDIYTMWLWHKPIVVISGFHAMKESVINQSQDFADRPLSSFLFKIGKGKGIVSSNGHNWRQQRRFTQTALRTLGVGKKDMESKIEPVTHRLVETFARTKGQPIDPLPLITSSVCNMISLSILGHCFSPEDTKFQMILEDISNFTKFGGSAFLVLNDLFPWLMKHLPGPHQKIQESVEKGILIVKEEAEKHSQDLAQRKPNDFLDLYLLEIEKKHSEPNSTFDSGNMTHTILELFFAGTETTSSFLQWALFFMVAYPAVQGARVCLGEALVRMESFLFFTNLLRTFKLQRPEGVKEPSQEPLLGVILHPHPFKLCALPHCRPS